MTADAANMKKPTRRCCSRRTPMNRNNPAAPRRRALKNNGAVVGVPPPQSEASLSQEPSNANNNDDPAVKDIRHIIYDECGLEPWFMGYLPAKVVAPLLKSRGDFGLVYQEQPVLLVMGEQQRHELVLCVNGESGEACVRGHRRGFRSVRELVAYHRKKLLYVRGEAVRLTREVPPPDWLLAAASLHTDELICDNEGLHVIFRGKMYSSIAVAVKKPAPSLHTKVAEKAMMTLVNEAIRTGQLTHPNLVITFGIACLQLPILIANEYAPGVTLQKLLHDRAKEVAEPDRLRLFAQLASALAYIHNENILHRQIVTENVIINERGHAKLCGFGIAATPDELNAMKPDALAQQRIAIRSTAPEVITSRKCTFTLSCDVWAFGMLMWEVYNDGEKAWAGFEPRRIATRIRRVQMPPCPAGMPAATRVLVEGRCWLRESKERASAAELRNFFVDACKKLPLDEKGTLMASQGLLHRLAADVTSSAEELRVHDDLLKFVAEERKKHPVLRKSIPVDVIVDENTTRSVHSGRKVGSRARKASGLQKRRGSKNPNNTGSTTTTNDTKESEQLMEHRVKPGRVHPAKPAKDDAKEASPAPPKVKLPRPPKAHDDIDDDFSGSLKAFK